MCLNTCWRQTETDGPQRSFRKALKAFECLLKHISNGLIFALFITVQYVLNINYFCLRISCSGWIVSYGNQPIRTQLCRFHPGKPIWKDLYTLLWFSLIYNVFNALTVSESSRVTNQILRARLCRIDPLKRFLESCLLIANGLWKNINDW